MKTKDKNKYYIISGINLYDNNRGTAAMGYGSFSFLKDKQKTHGLIASRLVLYFKPWKFNFRNGKKEKINIGYEEVHLQIFYIWFIDFYIYKNIPLFSRFTRTANILRKVRFVAAINGGDGFSDIYGTKTFKSRLFDINLAIQENIPLIILPQTLGPFKDESNLKIAKKILKYASKVYVRDNKFQSELNQFGISFELTNDLSYYMKPEKIDIEILPNAVGLNVSGLCYSNKFRDLSGRFEIYPQLIYSIIKYFQDKNVPIYLIAHSFNYKNPEESNDDMQASQEVYEKLKNKANVYLIDKDLTSPQTKFVISQFKYFIGTRMHANFAAIFTKTPVFGLAYSYKYEGAFNSLGLVNQYANVIDLKEDEIEKIVLKIETQYKNIN
jgi:polysaccharide pyruvyl transferase WcaK-like protein